MTMVRALRDAKGGAMDAAFAVDGPRGPYGSVQPGAAACAQKSNGVLVPIGSSARRARVLHRAWDRMVLPYPFARATVVIGPALPSTANAEEIAAAIVAVNVRAAESEIGSC